MKFEIIIADSAREAFLGFDGRWRSALKNALYTYLEDEPTRESKSRIKRLTGLRQPQYRLRVDEMRIFYDVNEELHRVEVLGFVVKAQMDHWLEFHGVPDENTHHDGSEK